MVCTPVREGSSKARRYNFENSMSAIPAQILATPENFHEESYLAANGDVRAAVVAGSFSSGRAHFDQFGHKEGRLQDAPMAIADARKRKMAKLAPFLRDDMPFTTSEDGTVNYLTEQLREETRIIDTVNVSSNGYDPDMMTLVLKHSNGLLLDCGAGRRDVYFSNVVNFEIVDYDTTDVLGVGEHLPFKDNSFDAVLSIAVLEHVRDPFKCAREIIRVLKPGGELYCSVPFLQPLHGYPHHYYNCTPQGIRALFEDHLNVESVDVIDSTHPIWSLTWILNSWVQGLPKAERPQFMDMKVSDLIGKPEELLRQAFCQHLSKKAKMELASATVLKATKPDVPFETAI
jgi:SAM-dependent methyltransferase